MNTIAFNKLPIYEVVFIIEFETISFPSAYLGLYWETIKDRFPQTEDQFSNFEDKNSLFNNIVNNVSFGNRQLQRLIQINDTKFYYTYRKEKAISKNEQKKKEPTLYDKFMESGLIGCCSLDEDLSTTYKQVLSDNLESKYDQKIVSIQEKLRDYPDWDREEQIKRNQKALKKLKERHQKTLQIDDQEAEQRQEEFERFKQVMDQFRPQGSKLYSED
ncbi:TIGR04255 family protein [Crocosphaera sp.]|uniref:TIGR04255 family protein n=1 Tax=Crocosphaera sp. TaxID=2729996 RepID=UPI003F243EB3|nr:TIGR04255 family protein [Crocosphaera sp.]